MPLESLAYLGDSKRVPYGGLSPSTIAHYTIEGLDYLYDQGAKALVIACNTATSAALDTARTRYDVPVVGVIQPTARTVGLGGSRIGVLATLATAASGAYKEEILKWNPSAVVRETACPRLASIVESGDLTSASTLASVREYVEPLCAGGIDTLVLGCTHYPFLRLSIARVAGPGVTIIECGPPVVEELRALIESGIIAAGTAPDPMKFATTGDPVMFRRFVSMLWPEQDVRVDQVDLEVSDERLHLQAA